MTPRRTARGREDRHDLAWWILALALVFGGVARWSWIDDMEWKDDERWSFRMSQEVGRTEPWPWVGMKTSLGFPNPGLSVWMFVAIGRIATTPPSMAHAIVLLNLIGLLGFVWAVRAYVPLREREPWIWGLALQSVSPYAIRISRKIWPPSTLTPLLLVLWISHQHRQARWGAFAWGLIGALIGQVHLSGWFVVTGLAVGTVVAEYRGSLARSRFWHWWLAGTVLGLISAVPWAIALTDASSPRLGGNELSVVARIPGYLYGLPAAASGAFPYQFLGIGTDTENFIVQPIVDHIPTHINEFLCVYILLALLARIVMRLIHCVIVPGLVWAWRTIKLGSISRLDADGAASPAPASDSGEFPSTGFYLWSALLIPSIIYVVAADTYFYHYYFVMCPFLFVLVAKGVLPWRRLLLGVVLAQALISVSYLNYVHRRGGAPFGEYGLSYARQGNR